MNIITEIILAHPFISYIIGGILTLFITVILNKKFLWVRKYDCDNDIIGFFFAVTLFWPIAIIGFIADRIIATINENLP
jgi:hypothetical protein